MKLYTSIKYLGVIIALVLVVASCSKMNETYKDFLEGGEYIYVGKADSVKCRGGKNRIQVEFLLVSDPKIVKYVIYWNNRVDSIVNPVSRSEGVDTIRVVVDRKLMLGPNNFEIYTFDKEGNKSMKVEAQGFMYDESFQSQIVVRGLKPFSRFADTSIVTWFPSVSGEVRTEITYIDKSDVTHVVSIYPTSNEIDLKNYKPGSIMSYRSFYEPEPNAYDLYVTSPSTAELPQIEKYLSPAGFNIITAACNLGQLDATNWKLANLFDGNIGTSWASTNAPLASQGVYDKWITIDLGQVVNLNRFIAWLPSDRPFRSNSIKTWEVWGRDDDPTADANTWNGWTKIMDCQSNRPSGLPTTNATLTDADKAALANGEEFLIPDGAPQVRYVRMRIMSIYDMPNFPANTLCMFGELKFYAKK